MNDNKISRKGFFKKMIIGSKLVAGFSVALHGKNVIENVSRENKPNVPNSKENITHIDQPFLKSILNSKYKFKNFTVHSGNETVFYSAWEVASDPGVVTNPLVINGKSGTGKTHLLQAIGNKVKNENKQSNVLYITCDLVLFDDIHYVFDRKYVQRELIFMFRNLNLNDVQVVIAGCLPSLEMDYFADRLDKLFERGEYIEIS